MTGLKIFLWFEIFAFPIGRISELTKKGKLNKLLVWPGSIWLGAMVYFFMIFIVADALNFFLSLSLGKSLFQMLSPNLLNAVGFAIIGGVAVILGYGYFMARHPRISRVKLPVKRLPASQKVFKIVQLSDVHINTIFSKKRLERLVRRVNQLKPDLIVITGDLMDENAAKSEKIVTPISKFKSRFGVYAVTGNHEYYSGVKKAIDVMEKAGIRVLKNESVQIGNVLNLVGVHDIEAKRFVNEPVVPYSELLSSVNPDLPTILLNHRPNRLEEASRAGINVQLSGHTHHGQLFPFNYVTDWVYDVSSGLKKVGEMFVYVSNGVGTWGPPLRIGAPAEIVEIRLEND
ncbi:MAG: metallophosphoesterase [Calditrichaeota bacterium]|nr:metallophosphoesterase [Calditrichota bacterium]